MSLTEAEHIYAAAHESGVNDLLTAFFNARPRFLTYASPGLAPATPFTSVPVIPFPGLPGGIEYRVAFTIPVVDFAPDSSGGTSPLPVTPALLNVHTSLTFTVGCRNILPGDSQHAGEVRPLSTQLDVWARGRFTVVGGAVMFELGRVELVNVLPDSLESVMECVIRMMLQAMLSNFRIPVAAFTFGTISLAMTRGPELETDQLKVYGDVS